MSEIAVPTVEEIFERVSALPPDEIVGECHSAFNCIIASHLHALHPGYVFSVQLGNTCIDYLPVERATAKGTFYSGSEVAPDITRLPFPIDTREWRAAKGFDRLGGSQQPVTAREATCYLRGFIEATKEGWS